MAMCVGVCGYLSAGIVALRSFDIARAAKRCQFSVVCRISSSENSSRDFYTESERACGFLIAITRP